MGRGKKKEQKTPVADQPPDLSTLSLSENQPSTSSVLTSEEQKVTKPEPIPQPPQEKDEEDGLGLGLGGSRKKRPRKKKGGQAEAPAAEAIPSGPAQPHPPPVVQPAVQPVQTVRPVAAAEPISTAQPAQPEWFQPRQQHGGHIQYAATQSFGRGGARGGGERGIPPSQPRQFQPYQDFGRREQCQGYGSVQQAQGSGPPPQQQLPRSAPPPAQVEPTPSRSRPAPSMASEESRFKIPSKITGTLVTQHSTPINVLTNYLPMIIQAKKIHRYDVCFKPDKARKMIPKAFNLAKAKHFPNHLTAFDQTKNCYCLTPLPVKISGSERFTTNVEFPDENGKTMNFEVSFKQTGVVDLGTIMSYMANGTSLSPPTEAIQCIDVILRQGTLELYVKAGRQYFKRPANPINLGDGLEMWTGLFQSAIFTSRPFINIDVAHKGFPKQQPLIDTLVNDFRLDPSRPVTEQRNRGVENFQSFLKGLRVVAIIGGNRDGPKREFICNELVQSADRLKFKCNTSSGKEVEMTVADYFSREKKVRLRYPGQNCVWVGPRNKSIYYPIELLSVSYGQALNKQLNDTQLSTMVKEAATPPDFRKRKIEEVIKDMKYGQNPLFKAFGLEITENFYPVKAKILQPPNLDVGEARTIRPMKGVWQARRLLKPEALESWGFIGLECDARSCNGEAIIDMLMSAGREMGMNVAQPKGTFFNVRMQDLRDLLFTALQKEVRFLVIIVPTRGRDYYHRVKQLAETEVGILTQCIKEFTASRRMNKQTAKNIILKVNSKLMGINQALDGRSMPKCIAQGGVMVVGADVTHPSPDQKSVPSIAAVTASMDAKCFVYNVQLSIQTPKKEMIVEFEDMMIEHLKIYRNKQKTLPKKIYVFRDGVSEGQFAQVMNSELQAIHDAYRRLLEPGSQFKPEVLFLLVQKRHHTRLFLPGSPQNVEPGTVVDTDIVHARELDFYLVSHQAIKGTARPTRYHAVCNDGRIPHDEVEQLAYYLCHLYSRCMRAVSYPTPTYYAHLACLRARSLTHGQKFDNDKLEQRPIRLNVLDKMLEFSRMFFV